MMKTEISLLVFLRDGSLGAFIPRKHCSPTDVFACLGSADEVYTPDDLDLPYQPGSAACFPLVVAYGDLEFHFAGENELATVFVDTFSGVAQQADGGPLLLQDRQFLRQDLPLSEFLEMARQAGLEITNVREHAPPYAMIATTAAGIEVGFEHDDPELPDSQATLRWFCWMQA